ncbi:MAG: diguanylate cyclase [Frankiaceae bacterium]|jgi:diguanylate cyclase (GGDEF)-like protein|nr:diguanylate cyclase [Frankiaceae bacterium]
MDNCLAAAPQRPAWLTARGERTLRWLRRSLIVALLAYTATTVPGVRGEAGYNAVLDGWLQNAVLIAATLLMFLRVCLVRRDRLQWVLLGIGVGLYTAGDTIYFAWVQFQTPLPYPSIADVLWLAVYPFLYAGLVIACRHRIDMPRRTVWLDSVVAALGMSAVAAMAISVILHHTNGSTRQILTTISYPIGDLLLLVLVVGAYGLLEWRPDRMLSYLGIGIALFAAADTIFLLRLSTGTYVVGTPLDATWVWACVVIACAALRPPARKASMGFHGWTILIVPTMFALSSLGLLVYGSIRRLPLLTVGLATVALVCAILRAGATFREVQQLARTRDIQARTDALTGLGNRRLFHEALLRRIDALSAGDRFAVMFLDLDHFKEVNDSLGHSFGDRLLVDIGQRLTQHVRGTDVLVRLGGDEFAVLLDHSSRTSAEQIAHRLRADIQRSFVFDGITIHTDVSVGIAMCPDVATTADGLMQRADLAMYEAKVDRRGCVVYSAVDHDDLTSRMRLIQELRTALTDGQLVMHYQPKIDLQSGRLEGVEALVRWDHPDLGLLFPDSFIPEAERYGLMRALTTSVLTLALDQAREWQTAGTPTTMAINISASNLLDVELPEQIDTMLRIRGLEANLLTVEVTESTLMIDPLRATTVLNALRKTGVRVSVDDYGTGYSSLARLRDLPVDELKLDRSFIAHIDDDKRFAAIVTSTVELAHALGLTLVAEGIETVEALQRVSDFGCDIGQGYHISRPMPAEELTEWLRRSAVPDSQPAA